MALERLQSDLRDGDEEHRGDHAQGVHERYAAAATEDLLDHDSAEGEDQDKDRQHQHLQTVSYCILT